MTQLISHFFKSSVTSDDTSVESQNKINDSSLILGETSRAEPAVNAHKITENVTCGDNTGKKRILSDSPSNPSSVVFKKPALNLDDSLSDLLGLNDVFEADTPHWVPLIFRAFDAVRSDVKAVAEKLDGFETFKNEITTRVDELETKVDAITSEYDSLKADVAFLKTENAALKDTVGMMVNQVDRNE